MQFLYSSLPLIDLKGCFTHYKWISTIATLHSLPLKAVLPVQWQLCDFARMTDLGCESICQLITR